MRGFVLPGVMEQIDDRQLAPRSMIRYLMNDRLIGPDRKEIRFSIAYYRGRVRAPCDRRCVPDSLYV